MDPAAPSSIRALLREHGLHPRKRLGQHFLADGNILERIARLAVTSPDDRVIEIGAGLGGLTLRLAALAERVTAIEVDSAMQPALRQTLGGRTNVETVFEDFLNLDMPHFLDAAFGESRGVVAGNIPYNITSPILERLFEHMDRIRRIVLLVQREVAERLAARPGTRAWGNLSVFAQYHASVQLEGFVPAHLFLPAPDVASAIVVLEPHPDPPVAVCDFATFRRVVHAAFGYRRKTLANALVQGGVVADATMATEILLGLGMDPMRRGETLDLTEFGRLANAVQSTGGREPN